MGKLNARRQGLLEEDEKGFTLIELLVVVIIIGILAAIAIRVYLGIQNSAQDSAVKSDLTNAKTAVIAYQTDNGAFPDGTTAGQKFATDSANLGKYGFTLSSNTVGLAYGTGSPTATSFCIQAQKASDPTKFFHVTDNVGVTDGACS